MVRSVAVAFCVAVGLVTSISPAAASRFVVSVVSVDGSPLAIENAGYLIK